SRSMIALGDGGEYFGDYLRGTYWASDIENQSPLIGHAIKLSVAQMVTATVTYALTPSKSIGVANCSIEKLIEATPPITCISTPQYSDPNLLVALPHRWP